MATLITLIQAKDHLGITRDFEDLDDDIQLKLDQAEAIVLNYLKNPLNGIASISAANPAVVTTLTSHGLTSGTTYTISGTTTTPTTIGAHVITVTGPTTFTIPVNVTVGQSTEAGVIGTVAWTPLTVPGSVSAAILLVLTNLYENRGDDMKADADLWEAIGRLVCRFRDPALA